MFKFTGSQYYIPLGKAPKLDLVPLIPLDRARANNDEQSGGPTINSLTLVFAHQRNMGTKI